MEVTRTNSRSAITKQEIRQLLGGEKPYSRPTFNRMIELACNEQQPPFTYLQWSSPRNYVPWNWYLWLCEHL